MILYEFDDYTPLPLSPTEIKAFKVYLKEIWDNKSFLGNFLDNRISRQQPFFSFEEDCIKAKNYVGYIKYKDLEIHILPKIFKPSQDINFCFQHILYYLTYGTSFRFPTYLLQADEINSPFENIQEFFIAIFSHLANHIINEQPYYRFEEQSNFSTYLKGKIDTNAYLNKSICKGEWQRFFSTYEDFSTNNLFYEIIKSTVAYLLPITHNKQTKDTLQNISQYLLPMQDKNIVATDFQTIQMSTMWGEHKILLNLCKHFLMQQTQNFAYSGQNEYVSMMLPMEVIFEEFVAGFIAKHFSNLKPTLQDKVFLGTNEVQQAVFLTKSDIFLTIPQIVIDAKYKLRRQVSKQKHGEGIELKDIYQVISYVLKRGGKKALLIYPQAYLGALENIHEKFLVDFPTLTNPITIETLILSIISQDLQNFPTHLEKEIYENLSKWLI